MKHLPLFFTRLTVLGLVWSLGAGAPLFAQIFQRQYGNNLSNAFTKIIPSGTEYYVLGSDQTTAGSINDNATVSRLDANGQLLWTRRLNIASVWLDATLTPNGNLFLVGYTLPLDVNTQSLMGVIQSNGTFAWVNSYNTTGREAFTRVVRSPSPQVAGAPYYVLGFQKDPSNTSTDWDDVVLLSVSEGGSISWKRRINNATDDEFARDLQVLSNGDLILSGNRGSNGVVLRFDKTGAFQGGASPEGLSFSFNHVTASSSGGYYAVGQTFPNGQPYLIRFNDELINIWQDVLSDLNTATQVWESAPGILYICGTGTFGGKNRAVIMRLTDNGNGSVVNWTRYLDKSETAYLGGSIRLLSGNRIAFVDGRLPSTGGFGGVCAFASVSDLNLSTCMTQNVNTQATSLSFTFNGPDLFPIVTATIPQGSAVGSTAVSWQQQETCITACTAGFTAQPLGINPCGLFQFNNTSTGPAPLTYSWNFGDPGSGANNTSTATTPTHQYATCGTYTVCLTVSGNGCTNSVCQPVTFSEATPPVITCPQNLSLQCNTNTTPPATGVASATDNCTAAADIVISYSDQTSGLMPCDATILRTWLARDKCGNTSTCRQTIFIHDNVPPSYMNCPPSPPVASTDPGQCTYLANPPIVTDNCDQTPTLTCSWTAPDGTISPFTAPTQFPKGQSTIMCTAVDDCGNRSTCNYTVLVEDGIFPTITCPGNTGLTGALTPPPVQCKALVGNLTPVASDNCQMVNITYDISGATTATGNNDASGTMFMAGVSTVTYTAMDMGGNTRTCSFTVTVACDSCACPGGALSPNQIVNGDFSLGDVGFSCAWVPLNTCQTGSYSVTTNFNTFCPFWPSVPAHSPPLFLALDGSIGSGPADLWRTQVKLTPNTNYCFSFWWASIYPNVGGTPQNFPISIDLFNGATAVLNVGTQAISQNPAAVWTQSALNFNSGALNGTYTIKIRQLTGTLFRDWGLDDICLTKVPAPCNAAFTPEAIGTCGKFNFINQSIGQITAYAWNFGDPMSGVNNTSNLQTPMHQFSKCGSYTVCLTITCADGSTSTTCQTVVITDNISPIAKCNPGVGVTLNPNCVYSVTPQFVDGGSTDNCQIQSLSVNPATLTGCANHTVTLTVTDWCGNISTCSMGIQTIETTPPLLSCPPNATVNCQTGLSPWPGTPVATDNCPGAVTVTFTDVTTGLMPCDATVVRTWKATDACNNTSTCVQTVFVRDNVPPTVVCPQNTVVNTNPGQCYYQGNLPTATATDNCNLNPQVNCFLINSDGSTTPVSPQLQFPKGTHQICCVADDGCVAVGDICGHPCLNIQAAQVATSGGPETRENMASIQIQTGVSARDLSRAIIAGENCYEVSNVTITGKASQIGTFTNGLTNIGFPSGIVLATGDATVAAGPNNSDNKIFSASAPATDADLATLTTGPLYDAASIEFDITPTQNVLSFSFLFASEEYCERISQANTDVLGFFISGPGIPGGKQNIALVPSGSTPVNPKTVNHLTNNGFYVNNQPAGSGNLCGQTASSATATTEVQFDGFTRIFSAIANVQPCQKYHLKLAIADVQDGDYESAVFIRAGSLVAGGAVAADWSVNNNLQTDVVYENCTSAALTFTRVGTNTTAPLPVQYTVSGSATPGVDYNPLPGSVTIPAGQTSVTIPVTILNEGILEGDESIVVTLANGCHCSNAQTTLLIRDIALLQAKCQYTLTVRDIERPKITCPQNQYVFGVLNGLGQCKATVNGIAANATDNCPMLVTNWTLSGATTGSGTGDASGTLFMEGNTAVTYTATDMAGNMNVCVFTVSVTCPQVACDCPQGVAPGPELIVNGSFQAGNTGFSSDYALLPPGCSPKEYVITDPVAVTTACNNWAATDHTTGNATTGWLFFAADGSQTPGDNAWKQAVTLTGNTTYRFCAWVKNLNLNLDRADPIVEVYMLDAAGNPLPGSPFATTGSLPEPPTANGWVPLTTSWTAPPSASGLHYLAIRTANTSFEGNNFALDDISFRSCGAATTCTCIPNSGGFTNMTYRPNSGPNQPISCGQTALWQCTLANFTLNGNFACQGNNCSPTGAAIPMFWTLKKGPGAPINSGTMSAPNFAVSIPNSSFATAGGYTLTLGGICGTDTCYCEIKIETPGCAGCMCSPFTQLFARPLPGAPSIALECGKTYQFPCPPAGKPIPITGRFECIGNNCPPPASVSWTLVKPGGSGSISGTVTASPYFYLSILPYDYAQPGLYTLTLKGNCPGAVCDVCTIQFRVDCPNPCPCDVLQFQKDVAKGFATIFSIKSCKTCFSPVALNACDMVQWKINGVLQSVMTNGNQSFCHTFPNAGTYIVEMIVTRKKSDGSLCEVFTFSKSVMVKCGILPDCDNSVFVNPRFSEGAIAGGLTTGGQSRGWMALRGNPTVLEGQGSLDGWSIELRGNADTSQVLGSAAFVCLEKGKGIIKTRGTVVTSRSNIKQAIIGLQKSGGFNPDPNNPNHLQLAAIDLPDTDSSWFELEIPYDLSAWTAKDSCGTSTGERVNARLFAYVTSPFGLAQNGGDSFATLVLDNLCMDGRVVGTLQPYDIGALRLYPNPNTGQFTVELPQPAQADTKFQLTDPAGRLLMVQTTRPGAVQQMVEAGTLPAGMYFLTVLEGGLVRGTVRFVKTDR